jgi:hypothetical protein
MLALRVPMPATPWWIDLIVKAVESDKEAVTALVAADKEAGGERALPCRSPSLLTLWLRRCGSHSRGHRGETRAPGSHLRASPGLWKGDSYWPAGLLAICCAPPCHHKAVRLSLERDRFQGLIEALCAR